MLCKVLSTTSITGYISEPDLLQRLRGLRKYLEFCKVILNYTELAKKQDHQRMNVAPAFKHKTNLNQQIIYINGH